MCHNWAAIAIPNRASPSPPDHLKHLYPTHAPAIPCRAGSPLHLYRSTPRQARARKARGEVESAVLPARLGCRCRACVRECVRLSPCPANGHGHISSGLSHTTTTWFSSLRASPLPPLSFREEGRECYLGNMLLLPPPLALLRLGLEKKMCILKGGGGMVVGGFLHFGYCLGRRVMGG